MLKSITGTISSCTIKKEGITNNKAWKIFSVTINGEQFSTFDAAFLDNIGKEGTYEYEEKNSPDGQYVNKTLSKYPETTIQAGTTETIRTTDTVSIGGDAGVATIIRGLGILRGDIKRLEESVNEKLNKLALAIEFLSKTPQPNQPASTPAVPEYNQSEINNSTDDIPIID